MPIQPSSAIAELAEELKLFTETHDGKLGKLTDDMVALQIKYSDDTVKRMDAMDAKLNRGLVDAPASSFVFEMLKSRAIQERPKTLNRGQSFNFEIPAKNIVSGLSRVIPTFVGVASGPTPTLRLRSVIPTVQITSGSVQYVRETSYTNAAAPVAEGAAKPESSLVYTPITAPVETIAHYIKIAKQTYDDLPQLASALEQRLIIGLLAKEENQLLNGTGVTPQLQGFMTVALAATAAPAGSTLVDAIALAAGELAASGYTATAAVVSAADWTASGLAKDTTEQYIIVPAGLIPPVIVSPSMAVGNFLVGDFTQGSTLFMREDVSLQVAAQNEDDFIKNLLTALAEMREVLCIYQSGAFLKGTTPASVGVQASRLAPRTK